MEYINMQTTDIVDENIRKITELFPNCLTERLGGDGKVEKAIDFDQLRQELSKEIVEGPQERYQFTWPDKKKAIRLANTPTTMTLRPCREESVDFDNTENLYIEGDNLEVLKLLREDYLGKVKMIYVDPPYNTGSDFVYSDDFSQESDYYIGNSGQVDELGLRLVQNTESNGRFHTDWLNMIYPRLKVARELLRNEGVIMISIDDNEVDHLRQICDEIYGASNFIAQLVWEQGRKSMAAQVAVNHEYCLIYAKDRQRMIEYDASHPNTNWKTKKKGLDEIYAKYDELKAKYGNNVSKIEDGLKAFYASLPDGHPAKAHNHYNHVDPSLGIYYRGDISQGTGLGGRFVIPHPITGKACKLPAGGWRFSEKKLPQLLQEGRIEFGPDETTVPCLKRFLKETEYEVFSSVFYKDGRGASKRLDALIGKKVFDYPKDEEIIKTLVSLVTSYPNDDDIVMDFFSGSATTAHAVMKLNSEDGGHRKFILVQLPELTEEKSAAHKAGYNNICEIGILRMKKAGELIAQDLKQRQTVDLFNQDTLESKLDIGFRVLKLDSSNMQDVYYRPEDSSETTLFEDNVKLDRTGEDLLFQVMLECNLPLSAKIETEKIAGKEVFTVNNGYLIACFDENVNEDVIKAVAKRKPYYFVMRDSSLSSDNVADNFEQIFQAYSKETIRKIL